MKQSNSIIRIAIIEDLKDVANLLREMFDTEEDMSCIQIYHSAEEAIAFLPKSPVDVVIVDIGLPGMSGVEAIVSLREVMPNTQFCMFTVFEDDEKIFKSLKAGAKGYILKNSPNIKIISAARELYAGGAPMNPEIARKVINSFTSTRASSLPLTSRELELLELLSKGLLYKEIGVSLGITTGTVKQHIHKIYDKLQVNNRTEAINLYLNR